MSPAREAPGRAARSSTQLGGSIARGPGGGESPRASCRPGPIIARVTKDWQDAPLPAAVARVVSGMRVSAAADKGHDRHLARPLTPSGLTPSALTHSDIG